MRTRNVIALVAVVATVSALTPIGVMAATGTLVNITDPYYPERRARVTTSNSLQTEGRAGIGPNTWNVSGSTTRITRLKLAEATGPDRLALTEVTLGSHGPVSSHTYGHNDVEIVSYVQDRGTEPCGAPSTGYTRKTLRHFIVRNLTPSFQVVWNGPALAIPRAPAGKKSCVQLEVTAITTETTVYLGASGYRIDG